MSLSGRCLCGAVSFACDRHGTRVHECHCSQCRRWSGLVWAYLTVDWSALSFVRQDGLRWYRHTPKARRGFCGECGATLFFRNDNDPGVDISAGVLDKPTGLHLGEASHAASHGDHCKPGWLR
ncbi:GFA family protein [Paracoccus fontiphilus]|uniref:GFA family protein n=1 Tax=Paracoccus fontiphilus TaxID=1815556 RepID=A0ABV7IF97_9RHOB|nr:GFA family protein [Paracoccus fontiphilus]